MKKTFASSNFHIYSVFLRNNAANIILGKAEFLFVSGVIQTFFLELAVDFKRC